ncbi:unnamed protein product, partial [Ixodes persulcatus]
GCRGGPLLRKLPGRRGQEVGPVPLEEPQRRLDARRGAHRPQQLLVARAGLVCLEVDHRHPAEPAGVLQVRGQLERGQRVPQEGRRDLDTGCVMDRSRLGPPTLAGHEMEVATVWHGRRLQARPPCGDGPSLLLEGNCAGRRGLLVPGPPRAGGPDPLCGVTARWLAESAEPAWRCPDSASDARSWGHLHGRRPRESGRLDPGHPPRVLGGA